MKNKLLIIEDNICKFFTMKHLLESQLKVSVKTIDTTDARMLFSVANDLEPNAIMFCPNGGVGDLLERMKKRGVNRRNTEITLLHFHDTDEYSLAKIHEAFDGPGALARAA
jgi:hypothetical protein